MKYKRLAKSVLIGGVLAGLTAMLSGCAMGRAAVSGYVEDSETGEPITGVEIVVGASYWVYRTEP